MLGGRKITAMLTGDTLERSVAGDCPHGGVLSTMMWSLVVDKLNENEYCTVGYADDIAIPIRRKFLPRSQSFYKRLWVCIQQWCYRNQLSINPQKMVMVPFTRKRDLRDLNVPTFSGHTLQLTTWVKYLGFFLDWRLILKQQLKNVINKA
jgi:hypothetical protein